MPAKSTDSDSTPPGDAALAFDTIGLVTESWLPTPLRKRPLLFWCAAFLVSMVVTIALSRNQTSPRNYFLLCGVLQFASLLMVPVALRWCSSLFLPWGRSVGTFVGTSDALSLCRWYNSQMKFFEGSKKMYVSGAALGLLADAAYFLGDYFVEFSPREAVWAWIVVFVSAFLAGCGLWALIRGSEAVHRLGTDWRSQFVVVPGRFGILSTGRVLAQCWSIIGAVWFVYTLSALCGPRLSFPLQLNHTYPILLVGLPALPLIVGTFVRAQLPMHAGMLDYKKRELERIDRMLRTLRPTVVSDLSKETQEKIDFLIKRRAETESLPEWPFSRSAFTGVSGSAMSALFPLLAKVFEASAVFKHLTVTFAGLIGSEGS